MLLYDFRQFAGAVVCIRTAVTALAREFAGIAGTQVTDEEFCSSD